MVEGSVKIHRREFFLLKRGSRKGPPRGIESMKPMGLIEGKAMDTENEPWVKAQVGKPTRAGLNLNRCSCVTQNVVSGVLCKEYISNPRYCDITMALYVSDKRIQPSMISMHFLSLLAAIVAKFVERSRVSRIDKENQRQRNTDRKYLT